MRVGRTRAHERDVTGTEKSVSDGEFQPTNKEPRRVSECTESARVSTGCTETRGHTSPSVYLWNPLSLPLTQTSPTPSPVSPMMSSRILKLELSLKPTVVHPFTLLWEVWVPRHIFLRFQVPSPTPTEEVPYPQETEAGWSFHPHRYSSSVGPSSPPAPYPSQNRLMWSQSPDDSRHSDKRQYETPGDRGPGGRRSFLDRVRDGEEVESWTLPHAPLVFVGPSRKVEETEKSRGTCRRFGILLRGSTSVSSLSGSRRFV